MPETLRLPDSATFGAVTYPPGGTFGPRIQRDCQVFTVYEGSADVEIDRSLQIGVGAGYGLLLLPGRREQFRFSATGPTRHGWCHLAYGDGPPPIAAVAELTSHAWILGSAPAALLDIGIALQGQDGSNPFARQIGAVLLASLVRATAEGFAYGSTRSPVTPAVDRALSFIRARSHRAIHVDDIADAAGTTAGNLRRLFQAELGASPADLLWSERVESGIRLLQSTGLSIAEVAELAGFKSPFHFSRRVKLKTGLSPAALRRRHWGDQPAGNADLSNTTEGP